MTNPVRPDPVAEFAVCIITQGQWGERIADNIGDFHPIEWRVQRWKAPAALPLVIDDPEEFLPPHLAPADLVLALGETAGLAQLVPDVARLTGARAVIAPIDRNESLPPGLARQLAGWLADLGVTAVFPKPFCSLTETTYNQPPLQIRYDHPLISRFARAFGQPRFVVSFDSSQRLSTILVGRDAACGCGQHVARGLGGCAVEAAEGEAGMLHHHYPCLASMNQDADYHDTLMHVSGNIMRAAVRAEIADYLEPVAYLRPSNRVESAE